jgi:hypothetical protein
LIPKLKRAAGGAGGENSIQNPKLLARFEFNLSLALGIGNIR